MRGKGHAGRPGGCPTLPLRAPRGQRAVGRPRPPHLGPEELATDPPGDSPSRSRERSEAKHPSFDRPMCRTPEGPRRFCPVFEGQNFQIFGT